MATIDTTPICIRFYTENIVCKKVIIHIQCASEYTNTYIHHVPADSQHRLSGHDSKRIEIHCMCLCCSHTLHISHECFLPTAAEDIKKTCSSVVSDSATKST